MVAAPGWQTQDGVRYVVLPPRLAAVVSPRPDGDFHMLTSAQALARRPDALALIDGAMFRAVGAQDRGENDTAYYRRVDRGKPNWRLVDRAGGVSVPSTRPRDGLTIAVMADGTTSVQSGDAAPADAAFAIQLYPLLVRHGAVVASNVGPNAQTNWRAGLGVTRDGRLMFAVGRKSMVDFARALLAAGAADAGYTDGGGSGRIALAGGETYGSSENRPVPVWVAGLATDAAPTPVPSAPSTPSAPHAPSAPVATGSAAGTLAKVVVVIAVAMAVAGGKLYERKARR